MDPTASVVAGSDARVVSPLFTDLDEIPASADDLPTVAVSSVLSGVLDAPSVEAAPGPVGRYRTVLTAADHLPTLDLLTLTWSAEVEGAARTLTQTVEVAGGVYVPTDELAGLRTVPEVGGSIADVRMWRRAFERLAEQARGVSFVPRLAVQDFYNPCHPLRLNVAQPREVVAVWRDGVAQDLADYPFDLATWTLTGDFSEPVRVAYTHGYDSPPAALVEACRQWVRAMVLTDASDHQRTLLSISNIASGETYRFGTADWSAGRYTGMDAIDALINSVPDERIPGMA